MICEPYARRSEGIAGRSQDKKEGKEVKRIAITIAVLIIATLAVAACGGKAVPTADRANPASVYCEEKGGKVEIRTAADGSQQGFCIFSDGTEGTEGSGAGLTRSHAPAWERASDALRPSPSRTFAAVEAGRGARLLSQCLSVSLFSCVPWGKAARGPPLRGEGPTLARVVGAAADIQNCGTERLTGTVEGGT